MRRDISIEVGDCPNQPPTIDLYSYSSSLTKVDEFIFADCTTGADPITNTTHCLVVDVADPEGMPVSLAVDLNGTAITNLVVTPDPGVPDRYEICFTVPGQGGYEIFLDVADGNDCPTGTLRQPLQVHQYASLAVTGTVSSPGNTSFPLAVTQGASVTYTLQVASPAVSLGNIPLLPYQDLQLSFPIPGNVTYNSTTLNPTSASPVQVLGGQVVATFDLTAPGGVQIVEIDATATGCGYSQTCASLDGDFPMPVCWTLGPCPQLTVLPPGIAGAYVLTPGREQDGTDNDPNFIAATNVFIAGEFEVDNSSNVSTGGSTLWTVTGKNFWMDAGASISVEAQPTQAGQLLGNVRFVDCSFQAVCGVMWQGIVVQSKCSLEVGSSSTALSGYISRIQDANQGVEARPGSKIVLRRTRFTANHLGVYLHGTSSVSSFITHTIMGCDFDGEELLAPFANQIMTPSNAGHFGYSFAGIYAEDMANTAAIIGGNPTPTTPVTIIPPTYAENRFNALNFGIVCEDASLNVQYARFNSMGLAANVPFMTTGPLWHQFAPAGIYHTGLSARTLTVSGFNDNTVGFQGGMPFADPMRFGIYADGVTTTVNKVRMATEVNTGIRVKGKNSAQTVRLTNNTLTVRQKGIFLTQVACGTGFFTRVNNNVITVDAASGNGGGYGGIHIEDVANKQFGTFQSGSSIFYSEVYANNIIVKRAQFGIQGNVIEKLWIRSNTISLVPPTSSMAQQGISLTSGQSNTIADNTIARSSLVSNSSGATPVSSGMAFSSSPTNHIHCNTTDKTDAGVYITGSCSTPDKFEGNTMKQHNTGLYLGASGSIGSQNRRGNMWTASTVQMPNPYTYRAAYSSNPLPLPIIIGPNAAGTPPAGLTFLPTQVDPGGIIWFQPQSTGSTNYGCTALPMPGYANRPAGEDSLTSDEAALAAGDYQPELYPEALQWSVGSDLYRKAMADNTLRTLAGVDAYADSVAGTSIGDFEEVSAYVREAYGEYADSVLMILKATQLETLDALMAIDSALVEIPADSVQLLASMQAERDLYANTLAGTEQLIETSLSQLAYVHKITQAKLENETIAVAELYEINTRVINGIMLEAALAPNYDEVLQTSQSTLESVAAQCPLAGGPAVYIARTLLGRIVSDPLSYDDQAVCLSNGIAMRPGLATVSATNDLLLVPNPAGERCTVQVPAGETIRTTRLTDLTGRVIASGLFSELALTTLPNGIYLVQVQTDKGQYTRQLVVQH